MSSKFETIINQSDTDDVFELIYDTIIWIVQQLLGKGSGWIVDSVVDDTINISKDKQTLKQQQLYQITKRIQPFKKVWSIFKVLIIMNAWNLSGQIFTSYRS